MDAVPSSWEIFPLVSMDVLAHFGAKTTLLLHATSTCYCHLMLLVSNQWTVQVGASANIL